MGFSPRGTINLQGEEYEDQGKAVKSILRPVQAVFII
jgi:hypothetical protein